MINPNFYVEENLVKVHNKLTRYPLKPLSRCVGGYDIHEVVEGQDLYEIARIYFGEYGELYWTTIADANAILFPDHLQIGQKIKIPKLVVESKIDNKQSYEKNVSTSIKI